MFHWLVGHHWIYSDMRQYVEQKRILTTQLPDVIINDYAIRTCKHCNRREEKLGADNHVDNWIEVAHD